MRAWAWPRRGLPWPRAVLTWVLCAALPVGPYTLPLFQGSLSDSPRAYLAWIPFLAFAWAAWNLLRTPPQTGVRFRDTA
ncbi:MAG: hypothetical protein K6T30_10375, partial [Alicyclobacillus sp.]|nr:hypothetical protein [Alicyclobacillus sp.]